MHTSKCSRFNNGAPLRASRFKLQYLQTANRKGSFFLNVMRDVYCIILSTIIDGTSGGPVGWTCAREAFLGDLTGLIGVGGTDGEEGTMRFTRISD